MRAGRDLRWLREEAQNLRPCMPGARRRVAKRTKTTSNCHGT